MASLRDLFVRIGFEVDSAPLERIDQGVSGLRSNLRSLTIGLLEATGAAAGFGFILKKAGELEQIEVAFETMLRSAEKAKKLLADLFEFAGTTPFEIPNILSTARQLLAMGVEARNIIPNLRILGNAAAGLSRPIERLALAFGQVKARTVLSGIELKTFVLAGVPILDVLAKQLGKTTAEVKKLIPQNRISFKQVREAFREMSREGGIFFNLTQKQSRTLFGLFSIIKDQITLISQEVGGALLPNVKKIEIGILDFFKANKKLIVQKLSKFLNQIGKGLVFLFKTLKGGLSLLGDITDIFGGLGATIKIATIALATFTAVSFLRSIGNLLLGITDLILAFSGLGTAAVVAQIKVFAFPLAVGLLFATLLGLVDEVKAALEGRDSLGARVAKLFEETFPNAFEVTGKALKDLKELFVDFFNFFTAKDFSIGKLLDTAARKQAESRRKFQAGITARETGGRIDASPRPISPGERAEILFEERFQSVIEPRPLETIGTIPRIETNTFSLQPTFNINALSDEEGLNIAGQIQGSIEEMLRNAQKMSQPVHN